MADDDDLKTALEALARREGKSSTDLLAELLRDRVQKESLGKSDAIARTEPDPRQARRDAIDRHNAQEFPGSPVVRYAQDPYGETPAEAQERWLAEEAELIDGVHGIGGQSAGGIFGEGPIATSVYDPSSEGRAVDRAGSAGHVRLARVLERIEQRLDAHEKPALPPGGRRRLGRGQR